MLGGVLEPGLEEGTDRSPAEREFEWMLPAVEYGTDFHVRLAAKKDAVDPDPEDEPEDEIDEDDEDFDEDDDLEDDEEDDLDDDLIDLDDEWDEKDQDDDERHDNPHKFFE